MQEYWADVGIRWRGKDAFEGPFRVQAVIRYADGCVEAVAVWVPGSHVRGSVWRPELGHAVLRETDRTATIEVSAKTVYLWQGGGCLCGDEEIVNLAAVGDFTNRTAFLWWRFSPEFNVKVLVAEY